MRFRTIGFLIILAPVKPGLSPTGRTLRALELLQAQPGITAGQLAVQLDVTERAARRYVAILREAASRWSRPEGPTAATGSAGASGCHRWCLVPLRRLAWSW